MATYLVPGTVALLNTTTLNSECIQSRSIQMRYSEIVDFPRHWSRDTHPVRGEIEIEAERFSDLERRVADQTQVRVLGHDEGDDGLILVHVACTTEAARDRFERRWAS